MFSSNFTGLTMIKNKLIKPLLIATEKVVEYYFPEDTSSKQTDKLGNK